MNFRRLKWLALVAPIGLIAVIEYSRWALGDTGGSLQEHLLTDGVVLLGTVFFYGAVYTVIDQMRSNLERSNRELVALREASLDVTADLGLDVVLNKVVDLARNLIGAQYGALSVIGKDGRIANFVTSGIPSDVVEGIGDPPVGRGLLGVVLREGQRLRLVDLQRDSRSSGFPQGHPDMHSLLAVPIVCQGPFNGNLYLSEKVDKEEFTSEEEETLARFASQAAIAIDNAYLHMQVRSLAVAEERIRIAHELHDGQAQVLAYVNTKAQAVKEFMRQERYDKAGEHLEQLAGAAREVYADVREGILGLRAVVAGDQSFLDALRQHVETWQDQCGIPVRLDVDEEPHLSPDVELQLLRIVQEALANVRKHSQAENVEILLRKRPLGLTITVTDDGAGFEVDSVGRAAGRPRFGLSTMRERAESIGARFELQSTAGQGTTVRVDYTPRSETRS